MIELILNDKKIATDKNPSMTLVDFIRYEENKKGTKIVCREGDCGACSVLVGTLDKNTGSVRYQTITSCISPLSNASGKHIVTVEGLNLNQGLNQSQKSLKKHHASQCGFCTPGFVVAMSNYCLNNDLNSEEQMLDAISGNICRCTGYVSIINAAKEIVEECNKLGKGYALNELVKSGFLPNYFLNIREKLIDLNHKEIVDGQAIVAGGTDLYVQKHDDLIEQKDLRFITLESKEKLHVSNDLCRVSGLATVSDLFNHEDLNDSFNRWQSYLRLVSSEAIRNMATLAGNFVNASPIGDMSVMMLALNAKLKLVNKNVSRSVLLRKLFLDYKVIDKKEYESIDRIEFSVPNEFQHFNFEKVSKRKHLDIATVNSAILIEVIDQKIINADVAFGGVAAIPLYLSKTSEYLSGKELSINTLGEALKLLHTEISPISDVRGSAEYKRKLSENLFKAHFLELFDDVFDFDEVNHL